MFQVTSCIKSYFLCLIPSPLHIDPELSYHLYFHAPTYLQYQRHLAPAFQYVALVADFGCFMLPFEIARLNLPFVAYIYFLHPISNFLVGIGVGPFPCNIYVPSVYTYHDTLASIHTSLFDPKLLHLDPVFSTS